MFESWFKKILKLWLHITLKITSKMDKLPLQLNLKIAFDKCSFVFVGFEADNISQGSFSLYYDSYVIPNTKVFNYLGAVYNSYIIHT